MSSSHDCLLFRGLPGICNLRWFCLISSFPCKPMIWSSLPIMPCNEMTYEQVASIDNTLGVLVQDECRVHYGNKKHLGQIGSHLVGCFDSRRGPLVVPEFPKVKLNPWCFWRPPGKIFLMTSAAKFDLSISRMKGPDTLPSDTSGLWVAKDIAHSVIQGKPYTRKKIVNSVLGRPQEDDRWPCIDKWSCSMQWLSTR